MFLLFFLVYSWYGIRRPFCCLCAAIEGDVTKKFPTSIHWAGNRVKGSDCNLICTSVHNILEVLYNKIETDNAKASIQKIPGIELGKTANAVNFHSLLQSMVVSYCRVRKNGKYIKVAMFVHVALHHTSAARQYSSMMWSRTKQHRSACHLLNIVKFRSFFSFNAPLPPPPSDNLCGSLISKPILIQF